MSLCLASYPVWTDCAALIVLLIVCLYHCRPTISGHELVLGISPCFNWLCCTNCSPHCVSVSLSAISGPWHFTLFQLTVLHNCSSGHVLVLGILPCLNWLCCTNCSPHCVSVSLSALDMCLASYPVWTDCCTNNCSPNCVCVSLSDDHFWTRALCLASYPVWTDCAALIVLLTVCLYHCRRPFLDMSLCLASYPVWTDCAALIVLLIVCLYHCRPTISGHELVLGISPCFNWLCCTNCSPHCVSVSLSADHHWTWACAWHLTLFELTVLH